MTTHGAATASAAARTTPYGVRAAHLWTALGVGALAFGAAPAGWAGSAGAAARGSRPAAARRTAYGASAAPAAARTTPYGVGASHPWTALGAGGLAFGAAPAGCAGWARSAGAAARGTSPEGARRTAYGVSAATVAAPTTSYGVGAAHPWNAFGVGGLAFGAAPAGCARPASAAACGSRPAGARRITHGVSVAPAAARTAPCVGAAHPWTAFGVGVLAFGGGVAGCARPASAAARGSRPAAARRIACGLSVAPAAARTTPCVGAADPSTALGGVALAFGAAPAGCAQPASAAACGSRPAGARRITHGVSVAPAAARTIPYGVGAAHPWTAFGVGALTLGAAFSGYVRSAGAAACGSGPEGARRTAYGVSAAAVAAPTTSYGVGAAHPWNAFGVGGLAFGAAPAGCGRPASAAACGSRPAGARRITHGVSVAPAAARTIPYGVGAAHPWTAFGVGALALGAAFVGYVRPAGAAACGSGPEGARTTVYGASAAGVAAPTTLYGIGAAHPWTALGVGGLAFGAAVAASGWPAGATSRGSDPAGRGRAACGVGAAQAAARTTPNGDDAADRWTAPSFRALAFGATCGANFDAGLVASTCALRVAARGGARTAGARKISGVCSAMPALDG
jgi:hypothetical protein